MKCWYLLKLLANGRKCFSLPSLHHTFSAFNSAPSFLPHSPLCSLMAMLLMVCSLFEKSCFYKVKPLKAEHESSKLTSLVHWGWKCCSRSGKWLSHALHFKFLKQNWGNWTPAEPVLSPSFQQRRKVASKHSDGRGLAPKSLIDG